MTVLCLIAMMGCVGSFLAYGNLFSLFALPFLWGIMNKYDELTDRIWFLEEKLKQKDGADNDR